MTINCVQKMRPEMDSIPNVPLTRLEASVSANLSALKTVNALIIRFAAHWLAAEEDASPCNGNNKTVSNFESI